MTNVTGTGLFFPDAGPIPNPDQLDPGTLEGLFLGDYAGFALDEPDHPLKHNDNGDPTNGHEQNSDSFIDSAFAFVGEILGVLVYPIKQVISWVWEGVKAAAQWAWSFAADVWNSAVSFVHDVFNTIIQGVKDVFGAISDQVAQLFQWAATAFTWVIDKGAWVLDQLGKLASLVADGIASAIGWIWQNLIQPVTDLIGSLFGTLWDAFWSAADWVWDKVTAIATAVVNAILDGASWLWDKVTAVAEAAVNAVLDALGIAWDILKAAWDWITWMAEHTFGWFQDLFNLSYQGAGGAWINGITNALLQDGDVVEELIAGWIG